MNAVPQQYYDTCARVRQHLEYGPASSHTRPPQTSAAPPPYRVRTLPDSPPNTEFVRRHFPIPDRDPSVPSSSLVAPNAQHQVLKAGLEKSSLEERYAQLLSRLEDKKY